MQEVVSCSEAKVRWGDLIHARRGPVTTFAEIQDQDGRWKPTFNSWLEWTGYSRAAAES